VFAQFGEMIVRQYRECDLEALRKIHAAQESPYAFPDLRNPLFLTKLVLTDSDAPVSSCAVSDSATKSEQADKILGAALLRLTAEAYLLLDPQCGSPRERWQSVLVLHDAAQQDAQRRGLEDVHAWLPPRIASKFGRRIKRLGWLRDDEWTPFCKRLYE
jgi:hypothetical protein